MIYIMFWLLWAVLCYFIANKNNRDKTLAILMGLMFGFFAVIGYLIAGNKKV